MTKFAQKFILLFLLITFLPLFCLLSFHKMSMEIDKKAQEVEMLSKISQQFTMSLNSFLENEQQKFEKVKDLKNLKNDPDIIGYSKTPFLNIPHLKVYKGEEIIGAYYIENKGSSYEVLKKIDLNNFFVLAPVVVEIYDKNNPERPIAELNKPPFPINNRANFKDTNQDNVILRIVAFSPPGQHQKSPPLLIPQIAIILSSIILCALLILHLNKIFINPLNAIIENLEKIKKGNLDVKFETESENKEIKRTYETLNEMVSGLIEKEKLRNNFIQNLTHDLRAPIVAQNRALVILQEEFREHELISGMKNNNQDYLKMINLILECYKCDEAIVPIDKIDLNFSNLVNSIITALSPLSAEKGIQIINRVAPENLLIFGDYISINRVLMNLISNAIECMDGGKNKQEGKKIEILAQNFERYSTIIIQDNGCGIKKQDLDKIFEKYSSFSNSGTKAVCGLGLCIVKNLIQKNNGEITAESEVGSYTRFTIKLPNKGYENL